MNAIEILKDERARRMERKSQLLAEHADVLAAAKKAQDQIDREDAKVRELGHAISDLEAAQKAREVAVHG